MRSCRTIKNQVARKGARRSVVRIGLVVILAELSAFALIKAGQGVTWSLAISCTAGTVALTWPALLRFAPRMLLSFRRTITIAACRLTDRRTWQFSLRTLFLVALLLVAVLLAVICDCLSLPQSRPFWTVHVGAVVAAIVIVWASLIALRAWARRHYQFSIKVLLVAVTVVALICSATMVAWERPGSKTRIEGRVIFGDSGNPAAGVVVNAQRVIGVRPTPSGWGSVLTDRNGYYRLPELPAGEYNIWAEQSGYTVNALDSFQGKSFTTLDSFRGEDITKASDLRLIRGGFIAGRIVDVETGKPVRVPSRLRADIGLYGPSRPMSGAAIEVTPIQKDGTFRIRAAPGKNYVYGRWAREDLELPTAVWVDVEDGQTVEIELKARSEDLD